MDIFVALICVAVILWIIWSKQRISKFKKLGIPGPDPILFFGNILELYRKGALQCHEEWAKKYGRVLGYYYGMTPVLLVTDPQLLKNIFIRDFQKFVNREPFNPLFKYSPHDELGQSVLVLPGQAWKNVRSVLTPTFTAAKMKQMAGSMNSSIETMLNLMREWAQEGKEFDIHDIYQRLTMDVITRTAFGVRTNVQTTRKSKLLRATQLLFRTPYKDPIVFLGLCLPFLRRICIHLQNILLGILNQGVKPNVMLRKGLLQVIQHRRNNPQTKKADLLQLMVDADIPSDNKEIDVTKLEVGLAETETKSDKEENTSKATRTMSDNEIISSAFVVLLAGYETTSTALSFTTYLLAKHPEVQETLFKEINNLIQCGKTLDYNSASKLQYLDQVLNESLRIYPPVCLFTNRYAMEDVQYGNIKIPKDMLIQAPVYVLHHDSTFWEEPEKFKPERFSVKPNVDGITYLPFGVGPRNCLGLRFAQLEAKLTLAHLCYNFKFELGKKHEGDLKTSLRLRTLVPTNGVQVKLVPRDMETVL